MLSKLTAMSAAAAVASTLLAAPPGFVLVADSQAQFSGTQGGHGWRYRYDRGPGTETSDLPFFVPFDSAFVWCTSTVAGNGGAYCIISAGSSHPNTAAGCNTTAPGDQRPIREWLSPVPVHVIVQVTALPNPLSPGMRADLRADGVTSRSWTSINGSLPSIDETIDLGTVRSVSVLLDALGSCHMDGFNHVLRIYVPDCDGNAVADHVQIAADGALDRNQDGVLDSCQCTTNPGLCCDADLTRDGQVNGADLGAMLAFWGPAGSVLPQADLDHSGTIDGADLAMLLGSWGDCAR